jgi:hypothetical protein
MRARLCLIVSLQAGPNSAPLARCCDPVGGFGDAVLKAHRRAFRLADQAMEEILLISSLLIALIALLALFFAFDGLSSLRQRRRT